MSKAFTKEADDDAPLRAARARRASGLPPGAQNYMTAEGARRWRGELDRLLLEERPRAKQLSGEEGARRREEVEREIAEVQQVLRSATVVQAPDIEVGDVRFGARVTLRQDDGTRLPVRIVGVDEVDLGRGAVSWLSATAKALLGAKIGDRVRLPVDDEEREFEVIGIEY